MVFSSHDRNNHRVTLSPSRIKHIAYSRGNNTMCVLLCLPSIVFCSHDRNNQGITHITKTDMISPIWEGSRLCVPNYVYSECSSALMIEKNLGDNTYHWIEYRFVGTFVFVQTKWQVRQLSTVYLHNSNKNSFLTEKLFFPLLPYLNIKGGKNWMADYDSSDCFFVVADRSHHGYVSTSSNKKRKWRSKRRKWRLEKQLDQTHSHWDSEEIGQ